MNGNLIMNNNSVNLETFLKEFYRELWKSIENEDYILDFQEFDEFYEIIHESNIVGFIAIDKSSLFNTKIILDCYILPQYRGKRLLYDSLIDLLSNTSYKFLFKNPNFNLIKALISYGLMFKVTDDVLLSWINFDVTLSDSYKNSKLKRLYKKLSPEFCDVHCTADLYDLNNYCVLFKDLSGNFSRNIASLIVSEPRKYDLKKYNCRRKLKKITAKYLKDINESVEDIKISAMEFFKEVEENLSKHFTIEKIIGSEDKLNDDVIEILNQKNLSAEVGFKIRNDLIKALDNNEITNISIKDRFEFLINDAEFIGADVGEDNGIGCPFCGAPIRDIYNICTICGHNFGFILDTDEFIKDMISEEINKLDDELSIPDELFDDNRFSPHNNEFLTQFSEFTDKFQEFLGDSYSEFFEGLENEDFETVSQILNDTSNLENADWYFDDDAKFDNKLLKVIDENSFNADEVYDAQKRISVCEFIKHIDENITSWKMESFEKLNHIDFNLTEYVLENGYVEKIFNREFGEYFEKYSMDELKEELKYFDIEPLFTKKDIIAQLMMEGDFSFIITEKGEQYLKDNPIQVFFAEYLSEFIFYEFEKYYEETSDDLDIDEIALNFVNMKFKQSVKKGHIDDYLKYLEYRYKYNLNNGNYEEALIYLIQRVIYEVNKWYNTQVHRSFELAISLKTAQFFTEFNKFNKKVNLNEVYDKAFHEFKFGHLKNNKEKIFAYVKRLLHGTHVMDINDKLLREYFD